MLRRVIVATLVVAFGAVVLAPEPGYAVPSFTRQTGLTCAQCHVMFGAPVPNFTFTGKKFRMNGYRTPFVTEKIEAGEEGALGGKRLSMPLFPYISLRYQSVFAQQSKNPGAAEASPISSNPTSRLAIFTGGPVADNFGLWTELYLTPDGSPSGEWTLGLFSFDEYDLRFVKQSGTNVFGLAFNNQGVAEISGFGPWPVSIPQETNRGGFAGWSHPNRGNLLAYGWLQDRFLITAGASPGQNNLDWKRLSYLGQAAYAVFNSDERELWFNVMWKAGNDDIPIITGTTPASNRTWSYGSVVRGIDSTRTTPGPYLSGDLLKTRRLTGEVRYSFIDRGPHSIETMVRVNMNKDDYRDNASAERNDVGGAVRYVYNRTWGLDLGLWKPTTYEFVDRTGVTHDIPNKVSYTGYLAFQPAMNIILALQYANRHTLRIDTPAVTGGWNWALNVDFLF
ncbi:MAG TPA: hypothetical protein VNI61_02840 [Gemmatimonadales bacterium]|nr:hypothetical protein [Gemmatimonadales bacterium]